MRKTLYITVTDSGTVQTAELEVPGCPMYWHQESAGSRHTDLAVHDPVPRREGSWRAVPKVSTVLSQWSALQSVGHVFVAAMAAHVGLDRRKDIAWAVHSPERASAS